eukprot:COSAG02_NODE_6128_length_3782_cov_4.183458_1_plen_80_part_00
MLVGPGSPVWDLTLGRTRLIFTPLLPLQVWVDHGNPGSSLMPVSPVDLHDGSVFTSLQNGKLAERLWHRKCVASSWPDP